MTFREEFNEILSMHQSNRKPEKRMEETETKPFPLIRLPSVAIYEVLKIMNIDEVIKFSDLSKITQSHARCSLKNNFKKYKCKMMLDLEHESLWTHFWVNHDTSIYLKKDFECPSNAHLIKCEKYMNYYISLCTTVELKASIINDHPNLVLQVLDVVLSFNLPIDSLVIQSAHENNNFIVDILKKCRDVYLVEMHCAPLPPFELDFSDWEPLNIKIFQVLHAQWVTLDHMKGLLSNCRTLELWKLQITDTEINEFLKYWQNKSVTVLKNLKFGTYKGNFPSAVAGLNAEDIGNSARIDARVVKFDQPGVVIQNNINGTRAIIYTRSHHFRLLTSDFADFQLPRQ